MPMTQPPAAGASGNYLPTAGGILTGALSIQSGGLSITAGGLTVSAGGASISGTLTVGGAGSIIASNGPLVAQGTNGQVWSQLTATSGSYQFGNDGNHWINFDGSNYSFGGTNSVYVGGLVSRTNGILIQAGGLNVQAGGASVTGQLSLSTAGSGNALNVYGDIYTYRAGAGTGVIFLNQAGTRYLYWDGGNYTLASTGELYVNGGRVARIGEVQEYVQQTRQIDAGMTGMPHSGNNTYGGAGTPNGSYCRGGYYYDWDNGLSVIVGLYCYYIQFYRPNYGWLNAG
jgi:hypothetical protein